MAPPCEKPASTIRSAGIPLSISCWIRSFIWKVDFLMPSTSKPWVLSISNQDFPIVYGCFEKHKSSYIPYIQKLISDTNRFNEFVKFRKSPLSAEQIEYYFVSKLYEKLPFLALLVEGSDQGQLQQKIDSELTELQRTSCDELLVLDANNLKDWFAEIIKEVEDD